jgi:hypothetical protein
MMSTGPTIDDALEVLARIGEHPEVAVRVPQGPRRPPPPKRPPRPEEIVHLTPTAVSKKMRRNDPCSCGSGVKFKACCRRRGWVAAATSADTDEPTPKETR